MAISSINNKSSLDKFDVSMATRKPSEANMIYIGAILIVAYLVYQFIFLQTDANLKSTETKLKAQKQKVNSQKQYLSMNTPAKLAQLRKLVKDKHVEYDDINYKISYVDNTLTELSYLLFDDESWASFVDDISRLAKKYHVEIKEISNRFFQPTFQKITHVVEVDVKSKAGFSNMMKFLNAIEESKLVIDVHGINIKRPSSKLEGTFKIAVWGMKY